MSRESQIWYLIRLNIKQEKLDDLIIYQKKNYGLNSSTMSVKFEKIGGYRAYNYISTNNIIVSEIIG
jgi:hypothetical protein